MMLSCRAFFNIGAPILYRYLAARDNAKIGSLLISAFSKDPVNERVRGNIRNLDIGTDIPLNVFASILKNNNLLRLSLHFSSKDRDAKFWKVLEESAPSTLRHLDLRWKEVPSAALSQRKLPPNLVSVKFWFSCADGIGGTENRSCIPLFLAGLSELPNLQEWSFESPPWKPNEDNKTLQKYPNLLKSCKALFMNEMDVIRMIRRYGKDFAPKWLGIASLEPQPEESWNGIELPESVKDVTVVTLNIGKAGPLFDRIERLRNLRTLRLDVSYTLNAHEVFSRWPALVVKLKQIMLEVDRLPAILADHPEFQPEYLSIQGPGSQIDPESTKWKHCWTRLGRMDTLAEIQFGGLLKTSFMAAIKPPKSLRKIVYFLPMFSIPPAQLEAKFERIRRVLAEQGNPKLEILLQVDRSNRPATEQERQLWKSLPCVKWEDV